MLHPRNPTLTQQPLLEFTDMEGNEIFTLKNKMLALHKSFTAEDAKDKHLFEVKGHFSSRS